MRWLKWIAVVGIVAAAGVAVMALGPQSGSDQGNRRAPAPAQRGFQVFSTGGAQLGVTLRELDQAAAKEHKLTSTDGVLVEEVASNSAAEKGGIRAGDVIVEFDGERVRSIRQLRRLVNETAEGRAVRVAVMRDGRKTDLTVTPQTSTANAFEGRFNGWMSDDLQRQLQDALRAVPRDYSFRYYQEQPGVPPRDRAPQFRLQPREPFAPLPPGEGRLGVVVQELTPQLAEFFSVKQGALIATVTPDSPAARAGLKAADVITKVNGKEVSVPDDVVRAIRGIPDGQDVSLEIVRDRKAQTIKVKLTGTDRTWHA
jgi:serine protease Do